MCQMLGFFLVWDEQPKNESSKPEIRPTPIFEDYLEKNPNLEGHTDIEDLFSDNELLAKVVLVTLSITCIALICILLFCIFCRLRVKRCLKSKSGFCSPEDDQKKALLESEVNVGICPSSDVVSV